MTLGLFVSVIISAAVVSDYIYDLSWCVQDIRRTYLMSLYYPKFMSLPEDCGGTVEASENFDIRFENVGFSYPGTDAQVLKNLCFEIKSGERLALVGENGAGKSTVIKQLCRLYAPDEGRILVGGTDLQDIDSTQLGRLFGIVFQDYFSYHLTLRENVAFGNIAELNDDEGIWASLGNFFDGELGDLDMPLGRIMEGGVDLSGGQWQRVAMARGCFSKGAFMLLDEPTASLDPVAESSLYSNFAGILKARGAIMVSHRLASAKMADRIILLSGGKVHEEGSHEELMQTKGMYCEMFTKQSEWYQDERSESE